MIFFFNLGIAFFAKEPVAIMIKYSFVCFSIISINSFSSDILYTFTLIKVFQFSSFLMNQEHTIKYQMKYIYLSYLVIFEFSIIIIYIILIYL